MSKTKLVKSSQDIVLVEEKEGDEEKAARLLNVAREMKASGMSDWNIKATLERLIKQYPDTKAAGEAKKMIEGMK